MKKTLTQQLVDRDYEIAKLKERLLVVETENNVRAAVLQDHFAAIRLLARAVEQRDAPPVLPPFSAFSEEPSMAVRLFIKNGQFINAVKQRRSEANEGLREAKLFCDKVRDEMYRTGEMVRP